MVDEHEIFQAVPIGLLYTEDRVIRQVNAAFCEMFGYGADEIIGQSTAMFYPSQDDFDHTGRHWLVALEREGRHADERIMRRRNGTLFWCRVRGRGLDPAAPLARAVYSFADMSPERPVQPLSQRERQVAMLLAEGYTAKEIARRLEISPRTVDTHKNRLFARFGVRNSTDLVRRLMTPPI